MKLSLNTSKYLLDFLDGLTELNANDVMWQWLEIYLDKSLPTRQTLWCTFANKKYGEHTHEIIFTEEGNGRLAKMYIPQEVIRIPGEWTLQAFIRQYSVTDSSKYTQVATNKVSFIVADGLPLDGDGAPVNNATIANLYETAKNLIHFASPDITFEKKFTLDAVEWEQDSVTKKWMLRVLKSMHNISNVRSVTVERYSTETGMYENILYAYKRYATTGTVALLFDEKIEVRIIIKGES